MRKPTEITSIKDPLIIAARQLHSSNQRMQRFLLEGEEIIQWALDAEINIQHVFISEHYTNQALMDRLTALQLPLYHCSDGIMKKINDNKYFIPIIAVGEKKSVTTDTLNTVVLFLENLQDQGNIGTIIRTAMALGIKQIALTGKSSDIFNKKTITASRGTVFNIMHDNFSDTRTALQTLKAQGFQIVATSPRGQALQATLALESKPIVLVVGNETTGVSDDVLQEADIIVQIPMANDVESLNVGVAAGISMYELKLKVMIAMLSKNIRNTLGREIGVTHQLMRQVLDHHLKQFGPYSSSQIILMMIMVCDETMSRQQIEHDTASHGEALMTLLKPLLREGLIAEVNADHYCVTTHGESLLAKIWHVIEMAESKILDGFSLDEKQQLRDFLSRIQHNCQKILG